MNMKERITVRFKDDDLIRLRAYAEANDLNMARAVREVVNTFLQMMEHRALDDVKLVSEGS